MIHAFLLIGQSNAAGRGYLSEAEALDTNAGKLKVLRNGRWQTMYRPVNPDRPFSGTSLAESFAKAYSDAHPDVEVGIIPCADGGTTLLQWQPGGLLFDNAVNCAKLAMRTAHLAGVLWHQGEGDCAQSDYLLYYERLRNIISALRNELNAQDVPFLMGGLGDFLADCQLSDDLANYHHVNDALMRIDYDENNCAFVCATGLGANPDNLHFSANALKEFGLRYYAEYQKLSYGIALSDHEIEESDHKGTKMGLL